MKSQHIMQTLLKLRFHNLHLVRSYEVKLRTQWFHVMFTYLKDLVFCIICWLFIF